MAKGKKKSVVEEAVEEVVEAVEEVAEAVQAVRKAIEAYVFKGRIILPGEDLPDDPDFRPKGKDA